MNAHVPCVMRCILNSFFAVSATPQDFRERVKALHEAVIEVSAEEVDGPCPSCGFDFEKNTEPTKYPEMAAEYGSREYCLICDMDAIATVLSPASPDWDSIAKDRRESP